MGEFTIKLITFTGNEQNLRFIIFKQYGTKTEQTIKDTILLSEYSRSNLFNVLLIFGSINFRTALNSINLKLLIINFLAHLNEKSKLFKLFLSLLPLLEAQCSLFN